MKMEEIGLGGAGGHVTSAPLGSVNGIREQNLGANGSVTPFCLTNRQKFRVSFIQNNISPNISEGY